MDLGIIKKENNQKYLIVLLIVIALAIFFVLRKDSSLREPTAVAPAPFLPQKIEINFDLLEEPIFKELRIYEEILPFEGEVGRKNPFVTN